MTSLLTSSSTSSSSCSSRTRSPTRSRWPTAARAPRASSSAAAWPRRCSRASPLAGHGRPLRRGHACGSRPLSGQPRRAQRGSRRRRGGTLPPMIGNAPAAAGERTTPPRPRGLRPACRAHARGLLLRRLLQLLQAGPRGQGHPPARAHAGLPEVHRGAVLGGIDEAIAMLKQCSGRHVERRGRRVVGRRLGRARGDGALRRRRHRALGDGHDDRGRLLALRPPRDGLPGSAHAAHADLDERAPRRRGRRRQADPLLPGALRPLPGPGRRRLGRAHRRRHRRVDRRAGLVVGRQGRRHGAPRAHRRLRRRHRRPPRAPSPTCSIPTSTSSRWSTSTTTACARRSPCARALGERLWGVRLDTSETMVDRSLWDEMGQFKPTASNPSSSGRCAARSTPRASSACGSS